MCFQLQFRGHGTGVSVQSNMRIFVRLRTEMHTRYFRCSFMSKTSRKQHNIFQVNEAVNSIMLYEGEKSHNIQGVPQLSIHLVSVILPASTHPNCKSWGSFDKFRTFAT